MAKYGAYIERLNKMLPLVSDYDNTITYIIRIGALEPGYKEKGWCFVSTPFISRRIEEIFRNPECIVSLPKTGKIGIELNAKKKLLRTSDYAPLDNYFHAWYNASLLKKTGLASLIELQVYKDLAKHYQNFKVVSSEFPSDSRQIQLLKQGRKAGKPIPIEKAILRIRNYIVTNYRKNAGLPPLKRRRLFHARQKIARLRKKLIKRP